eukprot:1152983-Prorocentrum_minimum.AAC.1
MAARLQEKATVHAEAERRREERRASREAALQVGCLSSERVKRSRDLSYHSVLSYQYVLSHI